MSYYGGIDEGMVASKYEESIYYEDPDEMDDMHRNTLMDMRPDQPTLASDLARRDYQSTSRIKLRDGSRGDNPEHPEIFIGFTDKDPRGTFTDPDMKKLNNQAWARRQFVEAQMYNDDDHSVPSQGIHPSKMQHLIKHSYGEFKKRFKNFSTGKEALKPGMHPVSQRNGSEVDKLYAESERMDNMIPDGAQFTLGKTAELSNNTNIGWWQTSDHEFKVAQYGKSYKMPGRQVEGISRDTRYENEFAVSKQRKPSKPMVMLMSAAVSNKKEKHVQGDMDMQEGRDSMTGRRTRKKNQEQLMELMYQALVQIKYGDSSGIGKGKSNAKPQDLSKVKEFVQATQKLPKHAQLALKEEVERFTRKTAKLNDIHPDRKMVVINPKLLRFMDGLIRKTGVQKSKKTGTRQGDYIADANVTIQRESNGPSINGLPVFVVKRNHKKVNGVSGQALAVLKGESKKTHSYKNAKPDVFANVQDQATVDMLMKSASVNIKRSELMQARRLTAERTDTEEDNDFGENRGLVRHGRAMGSKYMTGHMSTSHNETDMNDLF